jgi:hypothetical protein
VPAEVGHEDKGALEDADQDDVGEAGVVGVDAPGERPDARPDAGG